MALDPQLAALPPPTLIQEPSYETRLAQFKTKLVALFTEAGFAYDVENLETDPVIVVAQAALYIDALLRERINQAIRATLLPFAEKGDLDLLAAFYDVTRMQGEDDDRFRNRIVLHIRGRSPGGTEPRYRAIAMDADIRVADASIYTIGKSPVIHVAIFSTDNNGVADEALVAKVDAALQDPNVRMVNDVIETQPAARQAYPLTAEFWVLPNTADSIVNAMAAALRAAWSRDIVMGRDVTRSWITAQLMIPGVQRVNIINPAADIVVPAGQVAALGALTLTLRGRDF